MCGIALRSYRYLGLSLVFTVVFLISSPVVGLGAEHDLFIDTDLAASELHPYRTAPPEVKRWQTVTLNPVVTGVEQGMAKGDTIYVKPFSDIQYTAVVDRVKRDANGTITMRARLEGYPFAYFVISSSGQQSLGMIRVPERGEYYRISQVEGDARHYVLEIEEEKIQALVSGPPLTPPPIAPDIPGTEAMPLDPGEIVAGPQDWASIDVMVVYTPAAKNSVQNSGGINNVIAQAIEKSQMALDNSQVYLDLNLVHSAEVLYRESGDSSTDLRRLRDIGDGHMDKVHEWRDLYQADLVVLMAEITDVGGRAYLLNTKNGRSDAAFSIIRVQQASSTFILMHEIGHNFGLNHHRGQNAYSGPTNWIHWPENTWSAGWRWVGVSGRRYCSVMTYESGTYFNDGHHHAIVAHISNPDVTHDGVPTGNSVYANNARTLREIKHVVAAYRGDAPETGSINNPFLVRNVAQAANMRNNLSGHYKLNNDIDLTGIAWEPVGNRNNPFTGGFDGAGHIIKSLSIDAGNANDIGLFGHVRGAVIKNTGIEHAEVKGGNNVGVLAGYAVDTKIREVYATGFLAGRQNVGGLVGHIEGSQSVILNSYSDCNVDGNGAAGGLAGVLGRESAIENTYATGRVTGNITIGGLIGHNYNGSENVLNSFWCLDTGPLTSEGGTGRTAAQMMRKELYPRWDFNNVWAISTGAAHPYPYLRWQGASVIGPENEDDPAVGNTSSSGCFIHLLLP